MDPSSSHLQSPPAPFGSLGAAGHFPEKSSTIAAVAGPNLDRCAAPKHCTNHIRCYAVKAEGQGGQLEEASADNIRAGADPICELDDMYVLDLNSYIIYHICDI
jgi:hypothetical protein